jgi:hypothetical protein
LAIVQTSWIVTGMLHAGDNVTTTKSYTGAYDATRVSVGRLWVMSKRRRRVSCCWAITTAVRAVASAPSVRWRLRCVIGMMSGVPEQIVRFRDDHQFGG